jgi:hypothetical protein
MMGSEERGVPNCLTTSGARTLRLQTLKRDRLAHRPHRDDSFRWRGLFDGFRFASSGRDHRDRLDGWVRRLFAAKTEFGVVDPHPVQNGCELSRDRDAARAIPRCLAIFMPHVRKADHFLLRMRSKWAVS